MSAARIILTFAVPGKQHISHCVPSSPLRFSKGAKTTTQLGTFASFNMLCESRSNQQLFSESKFREKTQPVDTQTYSHDAQKFQPSHEELGSSVRQQRLQQCIMDHPSQCIVTNVRWRQYGTGLTEPIRLSLSVSWVFCCVLCCAGKSSDIL